MGEPINPVVAKVQAILTALRGALQGEPLRVITYGSAVVIYVVARASGQIVDVSFDEAIINATAGAAIVIAVVEFARRYVSPAQ